MGDNIEPAPTIMEGVHDAAHHAYHEHADHCACRTVGHLTEFIADRLYDYVTSERVVERVAQEAIPAEVTPHGIHARCLVRDVLAAAFGQEQKP